MWEEVVSNLPEPAVLRRLLFAAKVIPSSTPKYIEQISNFAFQSIASKPPYASIRVLLENLEYLNEKVFNTDKQLMKEVMKASHHKDQIGITLISSNSSCKLCGSKLLIRGDQPASVTLYTEDMGTVPGRMYRKYCSNRGRGCAFTQHYGYHCFSLDEESPEAVADDDWDKLPYFISTSQTGFAMSFLEKFDAELLLGQISYKQKSDIYNYYHGYEMTRKSQFARSQKPSHPESDDEVSDSCSMSPENRLCMRAILDRRRLEEAHLRYSVLKMYQRYHAHFPKWSVSTNVSKMLEDVTPTFYRAFSTYYSSHLCSYPGCNKVMVLDGNMKNRRDICAASEAGYIQYSSLPGAIKSGCQLSPLRNSRFCFRHAPRVSFTSDQDIETGVQKDCQEGIIIGKKCNSLPGMHHVAWFGSKERISWELASNLPADIIQEYEDATEEVVTEPKYGVISHTVLTSTQSPAPAKRTKTDSQKRDGPLLEEGVFKGDAVNSDLTCNTEKDKQRLHHRTAGILAAMWPCGIVVMLTELFAAESKSQVYASLHQLLHDHNIPSLKYICYDDGCHLRRYANHPSRRDQTEHTKFLSNVEIVIDKMHMAGHVDPWCAEHCDPKLFRELDNVDTEVCEQHFSWLSKYSKITRRMNRDVFVFFILNIIDLHNKREEQKLHRGQFM